MATQWVMYEEEFTRMSALCERLASDAHARIVFLVDKSGQLIASSGHPAHFDTTSLASLTAGTVAAMGGLAKLLGESEFQNQFHEGVRDSLYMSIVGGRMVLVVIFDNRSSLGLVRWRSKKAAEELADVFEALVKKNHSPQASSPFAEISDEDIDNLFSE